MAKRKAKSKAKQLTENQQLYQNQINRLKRALKKARKEGYIFEYNIPEMPKRVTKPAIEKLKKIKPMDIYRKGQYKAGDTVIPAEQQIKAKKELAKLKRKQTIERKKHEQNNIPNYDIINTLRDALSKLHIEARPITSNIGIVDLQYPLEVFEDNLSYYEQQGELNNYVEWLKQNETTITMQLEVVYNPSDDNGTRQRSYATLVSILNGGVLTDLQSKILGEMGD